MKCLIFSFLLIISSSNLFGQCFPDRHNTNWFDAWISCNEKENPNADRPISHWIMYDLGKMYKLGSSQIWNYNDPDHLDRGISTFAVDFSVDGNVWQHLGDFSLNQGQGNNTYEGELGPDFDEAEAQFILITVLSSFGSSCAGFSEVKIQAELLEPVANNQTTNNCLQVEIQPNPFVDRSTITIQSDCPEKIHVQVMDMLGRQMYPMQSFNNDRAIDLSEISSTLSAGSYNIQIIQGNNTLKRRIIKIN